MKKYLYLISKKYSILAVILLLMFSSCNKDVLKEVPIDFLAPENAYTSIAGIQQGITGLHWYLRNSFYDELTRQDCFAIMNGSVATDVAFHGEAPGGNRKLVNYQFEMTPSYDEFVPFFWERPYQIIQKANVLIDAINTADSKVFPSEAKKNAYLAEAKFFRAWSYRLLVMLFGDVPLVDYVVKTAKTDFVRAPKADVFKLMEADLTFAVSNLPAPGTEETAGRITRGAAGTLLSEVYLSQAKFQQAADAASAVINGGYYRLMTARFGSTVDVFGSGDVFLDLFAYGNQNLAENREALWIIQFEPNVTGGAKFAGERGFGPAYFRVGYTPDGKVAFRGQLVDGKYTGYSDTLGRPVAYMRPTNYMAYDIWRSDWKNDIRNAKHNIKRDFYYDSPGSLYDKQKIDFKKYPASAGRNALNDTCQYIFPFIMKFVDPLHRFDNPALSGQGYNHKDVYGMRLAETYLLRAEAYVGLGNKTLAAADINAIRNRAKATPVVAANVDLDYILDERAREVYGEEWRHITLRRMGKLLERVRKYCNNPIYPACNIQDYNVLFPIPQTVIDLNIDAVMEQNPGYSKAK